MSSITIRGETEVELEVDFGSCTCECGADVEYEVDQSSYGDVDITIEPHVCKTLLSDTDHLIDALSELSDKDLFEVINKALNASTKAHLAREWVTGDYLLAVEALMATQKIVAAVLAKLPVHGPVEEV